MDVHPGFPAPSFPLPRLLRGPSESCSCLAGEGSPRRGYQGEREVAAVHVARGLDEDGAGVEGLPVRGAKGGPGVSLTEGRELLSAVGGIVPFFVSMLIAGPLAEEPGRRGTAYPRLRASMSRLQAGLLLGAVWAVWHLPLFRRPLTRIRSSLTRRVRSVRPETDRSGRRTGIARRKRRGSKPAAAAQPSARPGWTRVDAFSSVIKRWIRRWVARSLRR
ncbi:CPBP family intramembrane glutamic endopeptidase [Streptomyces sp. NPDC102274]|uniref:CPBP family intramembrane glutamic endopeptidase n=1 Tax=Streptomyces sp. NPDC102274 TaxID=3366151 RepID=UPI0038133C89